VHLGPNVDILYKLSYWPEQLPQHWQCKGLIESKDCQVPILILAPRILQAHRPQSYFHNAITQETKRQKNCWGPKPSCKGFWQEHIHNKRISKFSFSRTWGGWETRWCLLWSSGLVGGCYIDGPPPPWLSPLVCQGCPITTVLLVKCTCMCDTHSSSHVRLQNQIHCPWISSSWILCLERHKLTNP